MCLPHCLGMTEAVKVGGQDVAIWGFGRHCQAGVMCRVQDGCNCAV